MLKGDIVVSTIVKNNKSAYLYEKVRNVIVSISLILLMYIYYNKFLDWVEIEQITLDRLYILKCAVLILLAAIFIIDAIRKKYSILELIIYSLVGIYMCVLSYLDGKYDEPFELVLLAYFLLNISLRGISYRRIMEIVFLTSIILLILRVMLVLLNHVSTYYYIDSAQNIRARLRLGTHPNVNAFYCFYTLLAWSYLRKLQMKRIELCLFIIICIVSNYLFASKFVLVLSIMFLMTVVILSTHNITTKYYKVYSYIIILAPILFSTGMLLMTLFYNGEIPIFQLINRILNGRLYAGQNAIMINGVSLLPRFAVFLDNTPNIHSEMDCSYLRFLVRYGVLAYMLLIVFLTYFAYLITKRKDTAMGHILFFVLLGFCFEPNLFDFRCMLLFAIPYSYDKYIPND